VQRPRDRWRSAALFFLVVSLVKLFYTSFGLKLFTVAPVSGGAGMRGWAMENPKAFGMMVAGAYLLSSIFCFVLATALQQRRRWAVRTGQFYAAFQMLGVLFFKAFGVMAIVNFVFGLSALVVLGLIDIEETPPAN
jgi:membrane-associated HD superfamily phosphohydrolase